MRVMLAFDGSPGAEAARDLVASLSWPHGTAITVVTAVERHADLFGPQGATIVPPAADEAEGVMLADLQELLCDAVAPLSAAGNQVDARVVRGRPASALLDEAQALRPDLIVIGNRGHGPFATILLGSVSTEVVDHAPCPVLVARSGAVHRAVVGTDGSDSAQRAIDILCRWPIFRGLPVRVVAVCHREISWNGSMGAALYPAWFDYHEDAVDGRRAQLREIADRTEGQLAAAGLQPSAEMREGDPAEQLILAAREDGADLIVVGSRGLSILPRLVLGSVARKILLHANRSVLVVREPREQARLAEKVAISAGVAALAV